MNTREKIKVYSAYGGSWNHLKVELINEGFSVNFAVKFINFFRKNLGEDNSELAVEVYDKWSECDNKEECETFLSIKYICWQH